MRGIILPLAALTAACSAGKTDSSSQANQLTESTASATQGTSACAVLTQRDAEKVLGRPATKLAATVQQRFAQLVGGRKRAEAIQARKKAEAA